MHILARIMAVHIVLSQPNIVLSDLFQRSGPEGFAYVFDKGGHLWCEYAINGSYKRGNIYIGVIFDVHVMFEEL